jgi:hypothetical protein
MKARICLDEHYKKCLQNIRENDSILVQVKSKPGDCYQILQ